MRAVGFHSHGDIDSLELLNVPRPAAGSGSVLVRVEAVALNYGDLLVLRDLPDQVETYPHWSGMDFAGHVVEGAGRWEPGDRVVVDPFFDGIGARGVQRRGGLAEYAVVPAEKLFRVPPDTPFQTVAAVPVAGGTSYEALTHRGAVEGTVVIVGATGGVGSFAVQIAAWRPATDRVVAVTSDDPETVRGWGADRVVGYDAFDERVWELTDGRGADAVYNNVGGDTWRQSLRALRTGGQLLVSGDVAGPRPETDLRLLYLRELTVSGTSGTTHDHLGDLLELVYRGEIDPVVRTYPFEEFASAFRRLDSRDKRGKIVLTLNHDAPVPSADG